MKRQGQAKSKTAKQTSATSASKRNEARAGEKPNRSRAEKLAKLAAEGIGGNTVTLIDWSTSLCAGEKVDTGACVESVTDAGRRVANGDFSQAESLLMAQALTLNAMFLDLARRAQKTELFDHFDRYLRLAFKAQSQCRTACETLAVLKNPPVFARNANIAHNQQVNLNPPSAVLARAGNGKSERNELLPEAACDETGMEAPKRLDAATTGIAGTRHPALAAAGTFDRAANR